MKSNKIIRVGFIIISVIFFYSCHDNVIYYDRDHRCVRTCNGTKIVSLYIEDDRSLYFITTKKYKRGSNRLGLEKIDDDYIITRGNDTLIDNKLFKLKPNSEYRVSNSSNGDAAAGTIIIRTDSMGIINYSSKTSCK